MWENEVLGSQRKVGDRLNILSGYCFRAVIVSYLTIAWSSSLWCEG